MLSISQLRSFAKIMTLFSFQCVSNPFALSMAKTLWSFGHSECKRVKLCLQTFITPCIGLTLP